MSFHLFEDQRKLSKREKQENFRKSLDDQLRMKQEAASLKRNVRDFTAGDDGCVSGLNIPDVTRTPPGLDHRQQQEIPNASGSDGSFSPQEKQPYMSAVSQYPFSPLIEQFMNCRAFDEMNGIGQDRIW